MNSKGTILITTSKIDSHAFMPVSQELERRNYNTVIYQTDRVISEEDSFKVHTNDDGNLNILYNDINVSPVDISAAWYRKVRNFESKDLENDRAKFLDYSLEISRIHETIWNLYTDDLWLNSPRNIQFSDNKIAQLITARSIGFSVLETIITNDWNDVSSMADKHKEIIVKLARGILSLGNDVRAVHTKPLNNDAINKLSSSVNPFPGIYQPNIEKAREWRVTVVGDNVFPAAIYTSDIAKDDWRKHQTTANVEFKKEKVPDDIEEKCIKFLGKLSLKFGAFDFIEQPDGKIIFLECNPNGQYG